MEPQDQPHTLCPKCNNFILTTNFLIHQARCKGNNRQSSTYNRLSNIRRTSSLSKNSSSEQSEEQQRIPCPFCGYGQTLAQLDTHPNVCPHREVQCQLCHLQFPLSLMDQHSVVCTGRQRTSPSRRQQQNRNAQQQDTRNVRPIGSRQRQPQQIIRQQPRPQVRQQQRQQYRLPNRNRIQESSQSEDDGHDHRMFIIDRREPLNLMNIGLFPRYTERQRMFDSFSYEPFSPLNEGRTRRFVIIDPSALIAMLARRARGAGERGLSQDQIKKFPVTKYEHNQNAQKQQDEDMCAICYCNFNEGQQCMNLPCKHKFHPQCISKWLQKNPTCPLCKKSFRSQSSSSREQEPIQERREMPNIIIFNRVNLN